MFTARLSVSLVVLAFAAVLFAGCGDDSPTDIPDDNTGNTGDTTPPSAVIDLDVRLPWPDAIGLVWTVPGDDGDVGTASQYDIRYSTEVITEDNWNSALPVGGLPTPRGPGVLQSMRVYGLTASSDYHFAMKTMDEVPNVSALSNVVLGTTRAEGEAPAEVADLQATAIDGTTFMLMFTTTGDDSLLGRASHYDLRYQESSFGDVNWESATPVAGLAVPNASGERDTILVTGLTPQTNYRFVLKVGDEVPNWSEVSNVARELAVDVFLEMSTHTVVTGETVEFHFRAESGTRANLGLFGGTAQSCLDTHRLIKTVVSRFTTGTHSFVYDFFDPSTGEYLPPSGYKVMLCWLFETKAIDVVVLQP